MKRLCILYLIVGMLATVATVSVLAAPDPAQQRPDIFPCDGCSIQDRDGNGIANMQDLNPVTLKSKAQRTTSYRLLTMPGCTSGTVPQDLVRVSQQARDNVGFELVRNDASYDFTVRINCGSEQIRYCGAVTVFCLGRGFPYNDDVEISDIISTYYPDSRLGILLHEIMGHAVGTWNEQYASCGASCGFQSTPNLYDFMNTGPNSRHGYSTSELGRWERTMYSLTQATQTPDCAGPIDTSWGGQWNTCDQLWHGPDSFPWNFNPAKNEWTDRQGVSEWCCQQPYGGYYNRRLEKWYWNLPTVWEYSDSNPVWRCVTSCP